VSRAAFRLLAFYFYGGVMSTIQIDTKHIDTIKESLKYSKLRISDYYAKNPVLGYIWQETSLKPIQDAIDAISDAERGCNAENK
jgi:hypothetical protein